MKKKDVIKSLVRDLHTSPLPAYKRRDCDIPLDIPKIVSIIGVRRCGKTFLLYQLMDRLAAAMPRNQIVCINFEDERLNLKAEELDLVLQAYMELYPENDLSKTYFLFDEIQNVEGWEKFVRRVYDQVSKNIVVTGSNAKMLSSEIATSLRGRGLGYEVYPLNFKEYLRFGEIDVDLFASKSKARINAAFDRFIKYGGFPELMEIEDDRTHNKILQDYFQVMIYRDLIERYNIANTVALKYFLKRLFASATKQISVHRIFNDLKSAGIRVGKNTLYEFLEAAEAIFLVRTIRKYSPKITVQELSEKKVYIIDTGLLNAIVFKFSADTGKALEHTVYWELIRRGHTVFFYKDGFECDFLIQENERIVHAIQVCDQIQEENTRAREIRGLVATCKQFGLKKGFVVTSDTEEEFEIDGIEVQMVPVVSFLLDADRMAIS